jgi:hypothetical protein
MGHADVNAVLELPKQYARFNASVFRERRRSDRSLKPDERLCSYPAFKP